MCMWLFGSEGAHDQAVVCHLNIGLDCMHQPNGKKDLSLLCEEAREAWEEKLWSNAVEHSLQFKSFVSVLLFLDYEACIDSAGSLLSMVLAW